MEPMGIKQSSSSPAYGTDAPKPNDFLSCICGNATYLKENDVPKEDCPCYDRFCCLSKCCKNERCLCCFSHRSLCMKRCCMPFTLVLFIISIVLFRPYKVEVVVDEPRLKGQVDPRSTYYDQNSYDFDFNLLEKSVYMQLDVPLLLTNYNMVYAVTAAAEFQVYYPAHYKTSGVKLASGSNPGTVWVTIDDKQYAWESFGIGDHGPRMKCVLNMDCGERESSWKDVPNHITVVGKLEASSSDWSLIYDQIKTDCRSCSLKAEDLCTSTTDVYITGSVGPEPEKMPIMSGVVGEIEFEELQPLMCKDVIGCGITGFCPPLP